MGFEKIISGEKASYKIAENDEFLAFLDPTPLAIGHTIVIPKASMTYIFDIEDEVLTRLHLFAKQVAIQLKKGVPCKRIGLAVIGLVEPHTHIHLVPLQTVDDINFSKPKLSLSDASLESVLKQILL